MHVVGPTKLFTLEFLGCKAYHIPPKKQHDFLISGTNNYHAMFVIMNEHLVLASDESHLIVSSQHQV